MKNVEQTSVRPSDDSVTIRGDGHPDYVGTHVTPGGEEHGRTKDEPGRAGDKSTARFVTGIGADESAPIDKTSPNLV
jgi:hypothetical protein